MRDARTMQDAMPTGGRGGGAVLLVANPNSGRNSRDRAAIETARDALGAEIIPFHSMQELRRAIEADCDAKPRAIVAAGGDGTAMAVAAQLVGTGVPMGVLPLGTFNYFARGLGMSEDLAVAARQIAGGTPVDRHVGSVNGQVFLNNASAGIYPTILKEREDVYRKWGRRRIMAHWSVIKTFLRFRKPMQVTLTFDGAERTMRTPLVFVGRSVFQLERFGLSGGEAVRDGAFAVLVMRGETRRELFSRSARLALGRAEEGVDYDLYHSDALSLTLHGRRRTLLAYDGEKRRMRGPLQFRMTERPLRLILPAEAS